MKRTTPKREAEWRAHFAKFRRSKLTVVAYCRQAGISQVGMRWGQILFPVFRAIQRVG